MPVPTFVVDHDQATSVLTVSGDVDEVSTPLLRDAIEEASAGFTRSIAVDLSAVTYLPSVVIGVLAKAQQEFSGSSAMELIAADGTIAQRVLTVCAFPFRRS